MEKLRPLGTAISDIVQPTFQIYTPLLEANAETIRSTPRETHRYGHDPRHELDVYKPHGSIDSASAPIVMWVHGGGFVRGSKILEQVPGGLVYANVGHFFASHGYITVAINYRLVGVHDAQFPSGGEDVALAVKWVAEKYGTTSRELFLLGNSAGGVHAATFAFSPEFQDVLKQVTQSDGVRLKGIGLISTPFSFANPSPYRIPVLKAYYGDAIEEKSPLSLLNSVSADQLALLEQGNVHFSTVACELDPSDEILEFQQPFKALLHQKRGAGVIEDVNVAGHNHVSPSLSLGTGNEKEEAWGFRLKQWMDRLRG
jgi:alpha/beta superfamily hydrolase